MEGMHCAKSAKSRRHGRGKLPAMKTRRAEHNYRARVARVVQAIVANPLGEHSLDDLARVAHFSPFHFHRVYRSVTGETVAATVRRVRLAHATCLLEDGRQSVTQVALAAGYDSPQAVTRAFGQFTGQSPRAFQQEMQRTIADADERGQNAPAVQIVERAAQRVLALRHEGPLATIPHTQRRLRLLAGSHPVSDWLGVSCGDPLDEDRFAYYAAAASPAPWPADEDVQTVDIPAGRYALHCLAGPYTRINAARNALYARWLPASGYEPDDRPALEHYLNSPRDAAPAALRTHLLIPIRTADAP